MNKTVTINLSGIVFHIDENAYEQLRQYLDTLRRHFATTSGRDEIIADIETRFAEMFNEKVTPGKNVITLADVQEVINVMGKPEEVAAADEEPTSKESTKTEPTYSYEFTVKRFFRNPDDKVLGGVSSGIAAYFDIDPLWIRLAFILFALAAFGTGILVYIILWIIIPEAKTPTEKLQMRGEPVNLANIQKSVNEELEAMKRRGEAFAKEIGSDENKMRTRTASHKAANIFVDILKAIVRFFAIIFGIIITIVSLAVLIGLTVAIFSGIGVFTFAIPHVITHMVLTESQITWLIIGGLLAIGIPFTLLFLNGLKILFKVNMNLKRIGAVMAGLWLIGLGICIITGIQIASEYKNDAEVKYTQQIPNNSKTIVLKGKNHWSSLEDHNIHFGDLSDLILLGDKNDSVVAPFVRVDVQPSDNDSVYIEERYSACGNSFEDARSRASDIIYSISVTDSMVTLPNYFVMKTESKFRGQSVKLILKLPVGKSVMLDKSLDWMPDDIHNVTNTWDHNMLGYTWKMTKDGLECQQCPEDITGNQNDDSDKQIKIEPNKVIIDKGNKHIEISGSEIKVDTI